MATMGLAMASLLSVPGAVASAQTVRGTGSSPGPSGTLSGAPVKLATPRPQSASGCNQTTCIYVNGTGLHVNYVTENGADGDLTGCASGLYLVNGNLAAATNTVCWNNSEGTIEELSGYYGVNTNYANGTKLCVSWAGATTPFGEPCEYVEG